MSAASKTDKTARSSSDKGESGLARKIIQPPTRGTVKRDVIRKAVREIKKERAAIQ